MKHTLYIGSYTNPGGSGLYGASLSEDGKLTAAGSAESDSPSYIIFSSDKKYIYAANEAREVLGVPGGAVTAFRIAADGVPEKALCVPTGGGAPCHLLEQSGYLFAANYGAGNVSVIPLKDGLPGKPEFTHQHEGGGPNKRRQERPHAHCVMAVPGTDVFCVIDLGIDQARFYRKEEKTLTLVQALAFPGGAGPRHIVFSKDGKFGWVVTELSNEIFSIKYDAEWAITGVTSTLPPDFTGESACAAIRLTNDGKLIAASNRGHDSAAVFTVNRENGSLSPVGIFPVGGSNPRDINFSPDGKWLLSANQDSDSVTVLSAEGGFNVVEGAALSISKPACILF